MAVCPYCNQENKLIEKHKKSCKFNPENHFTEEPQEVNLKNLEYFKSLPNSIKDSQKVYYYCTLCGKRVDKLRFYGIRETLHCKSCSQDILVKCPECGKEMAKTRLPRHLECCSVLNQVPEIIDETNIDSLKKLPKSFKYTRTVTYKCKKCLNLRTIRIVEFKGLESCSVCDRKETNLEKFGTEIPIKSKEVRDKLKKSLSKRTKDEIEASNKKREQTCLEKYGKASVNQVQSIRQKQKETCCRKYGTPNPTFKYCFEGLSFDSSWELALWIYSKDHKEPIKREPCSFIYTFEGKEHLYFPDFLYKGNLLELKGSQFVKKDGTWKDGYGLDTGQSEAKRQCALNNGVQIWYLKDIQFALTYIENNYPKDFLKGFRRKSS